MEQLIDLDGQQFYYSATADVVGVCTHKNSCAIVVDEFRLEELLSVEFLAAGKCINQLIVIGQNVNNALVQLSDKNILLIAAGNLREAIQLAILSDELNKNIICIPKEGKQEVKNIIELILT